MNSLSAKPSTLSCGRISWLWRNSIPQASASTNSSNARRGWRRVAAKTAVGPSASHLTFQAEQLTDYNRYIYSYYIGWFILALGCLSVALLPQITVKCEADVIAVNVTVVIGQLLGLKGLEDKAVAKRQHEVVAQKADAGQRTDDRDACLEPPRRRSQDRHGKHDGNQRDHIAALPDHAQLAAPMAIYYLWNVRYVGWLVSRSARMNQPM